MAMLIPAPGIAYTVVSPRNARSFTLEELQGFVGGYIEALYPDDGLIMFLNEDGKRLGLPRNMIATLMMTGRLYPGDVIVGTVVVCTPVEAGQHEHEEA
jgi:hypothetical protein